MSEHPPTEAIHARSAGFDRLTTRELVELIVSEQRHAIDAVLARSERLARVAERIADRLAGGGTLHYVGAGTSGRLGMMDASEMPPTFGTPAEMVRAHIAGGVEALVRAVEGAEDDAEAGYALADASIASSGAAVGISASGSAAFVVAAIERARAKGAYTVAVTSFADSPLARVAEAALVFDTGAEVLAGSTRLKAGTAQKVALNALSTAVMVRLGKVYDNLMVDVVATNRKLRARAIGLVEMLARVDTARARELLEAGGGSVKVAVVMERRRVDAPTARALLERQRGSLRELI
jgi:N-acetylmuramic acid 6-phosphate etherase